MNDLRFRVVRDVIFGTDLELRFWQKMENGDVAVPLPIQMKALTRDEIMTTHGAGPAMILSVQSAQNLMDELWHAGLRPSEGSGSAGSLAATQRHLGDMRAIAAKCLNTELPK